MSQKIPVDTVDEATRAFDTKTQQYVFLHSRITATFFIAEPYDDNKYIIVNQDELTDLHIM